MNEGFQVALAVIGILSVVASSAAAAYFGLALRRQDQAAKEAKECEQRIYDCIGKLQAQIHSLEVTMQHAMTNRSDLAAQIEAVFDRRMLVMDERFVLKIDLDRMADQIAAKMESRMKTEYVPTRECEIRRQSCPGAQRQPTVTTSVRKGE